ncbi:MAG TPA: penicillin acylase family protein [Hyphomicrobiaceae bacterium]|jgi:penicillin amidase|nr:penicillin acylase family protein [Hyphomicrobiaceae bacterium]
MQRVLIWIAAVCALLVLLVALAVGGAWAWLRATVPSTAGSLVLEGLSAPVAITRDREYVPHIFASSRHDLLFALGFAHAQDRLWQMELSRRSGQGRLSEIFGERTFTTDVFLRTLDLYGHAERSLAALSPEDRADLDAYARGVNGFMTRRTGWFEPRFAPEFILLRHTPEPWRPADSMVLAKLMALQLGANINHELARLAYAAHGLKAAEIEDLMPTEAADHPPPLPELAELYPLQRTAGGGRRAAAGVEGAAIGEGASNNWVVAGSRTRSGKALLANDPHLGLTAPSVWYLAHLALEQPGVAPVNVVGASLAGAPLIVLGRTDSIAWGYTNTGTDVQDIFIEKINPDNSAEYLTPEGWRPFERESMAIAVKGSGVRAVERRRTRHGPVLPGFYRGLETLLAPGHVAALQWTALSDDDTTLAVGLLEPGLKTVADYMARMQRYVGPMQNMVVADLDGHIGLIAPGRVPRRDAANKVAGRAPVPGWDARYDWKGYVPFQELPRLLDPPQGAIGTANARILPPNSPVHLTFDWDPAFRQRRIDELIVAPERGPHDIGSMRQAQADVLSLAVTRLQPLMIAAAQIGETVDQQLLDQLTGWDGTMRADRPEPLIFMAWLRAAVRAIYGDDLGPAFERFWGARASALIRLLEGRATGRDWCDDQSTPTRESCGAVLAAALARAIDDLERRYGKDRSQWRWGNAHRALSEHRPLGTFGKLAGLVDVAGFVNISVASPGDDYTLDVGRMDFASAEPFANRHAASYRAIYDFADLDRSLYMHSTGQSGNPFSPFYRSFVERWAGVDYIEIATKRDRIAALGTWALTPRSAK